MFYSWKLNYGLFLSLFLVNISTDLCSNWQSCFNAVFSTSNQPRWTYFDWTFISTWTYFSLNFDFSQISMLKQHSVIDIELTLFCQRWNNVDKCMSTQLSFSTKYQLWNNVDERWRSTLFQHWFSVDVFAGMVICSWTFEV